MNIDMNHEYCFTISLSLQEHKLASSQPSPVLPTICVHNNTRSGRLLENWEGLGAFITWMMSGGHEVDRGGEGVKLPKQRSGSSVQMLYHSFALQTLQRMKLLVMTGKKLTFNFCTYIYEYWSLPTYIVCPLMWWMLPGLPCFSLLSARIIVNTEGKKRGGMGTRLVRAFLFYVLTCQYRLGHWTFQKFFEPSAKSPIWHQWFLLCEAGWGPLIHTHCCYLHFSESRGSVRADMTYRLGWYPPVQLENPSPKQLS